MNILALDLGTSSVRGLVLDADAVPLPGALARRKMAITIGDDGAATLNATDYLAALEACLDELNAAGHLDRIGLVATAAQWHSVLPLDHDGTPLGPVLTWLDSRATPTRGAVGPADTNDFHQRTGTWWHRFYWSMRLPWLRETLDRRPARFVGLVEYAFGALLEDAPMSISQASGTGLLDLRTLDWDAEALELADAQARELPELAPVDWTGRLRADFARRWPGLRDVPWCAPTGDGAASNVGSGCVDPYKAAVTVGTSAAVRLVQAAPAGAILPPLPAGLWRYRVDHRHIVTGTAYSAGGNLFAWANKVLLLPGGAELEAALAAIRPGETLVADPRLGGDRPPGVAPSGSGHVHNLSFGTRAVDIFAGLMDALCRQVAADLGQIESTVDYPVEVVLGGGAVAASDWWRNAFVAALSPRRVSHVRNPEIGATGAALIAIGRFHDGVTLERISRMDEGH